MKIQFKTEKEQDLYLTVIDLIENKKVINGMGWIDENKGEVQRVFSFMEKELNADDIHALRPYISDYKNPDVLLTVGYEIRKDNENVSIEYKKMSVMWDEKCKCRDINDSEFTKFLEVANKDLKRLL